MRQVRTLARKVICAAKFTDDTQGRWNGGHRVLVNNLAIHHIVRSFKVGKFQPANGLYRQSDGLVCSARRTRESQALSLGAQHAEHLSAVKPLAVTVRTEAHDGRSPSLKMDKCTGGMLSIVSGMSGGGAPAHSREDSPGTAQEGPSIG